MLIATVNVESYVFNTSTLTVLSPVIAKLDRTTFPFDTSIPQIVNIFLKPISLKVNVSVLPVCAVILAS